MEKFNKKLDFECKKCNRHEHEVDAVWFSQFLTKPLTLIVEAKLKSKEVFGARIVFENGCPSCLKQKHSPKKNRTTQLVTEEIGGRLERLVDGVKLRYQVGVLTSKVGNKINKSKGISKN